MNRAERRKVRRVTEKAEKVVNSLSPKQLEFLDNVSNYRAREMSEQYIDKFKDLMDRNISAALIEIGFYTKQIKDFEERLAELLLEDAEKLEEFQSKFKSKEEAKMELEKISEKVRGEVENLLKDGVKKKEAIQDLAFKFPMLSKAQLINAYQKVKEENEREIEKAVEYIFEEKKDTEDQEKVNEKEKKGETKVKGLKVLEERIVKMVTVEGENGKYEAHTEKGISLSRDDVSISFENEEQLNKWVKEFMAVFKMVM